MIQMPSPDPQSINNNKPSMRGINCRNSTAPEIRQLESDSDMDDRGNNDVTFIQVKKLIEQIHDDNIAIVFLVPVNV